MHNSNITITPKFITFDETRKCYKGEFFLFYKGRPFILEMQADGLDKDKIDLIEFKIRVRNPVNYYPIALPYNRDLFEEIEQTAWDVFSEAMEKPDNVLC